MQIKPVGKECGFSLIEVMVAVVLLSIGVLAVGGGEVAVLTQNSRTSERMRAIAAAENIVDLMRRNSDKITDYNNFNIIAMSTPARGNPLTAADFDFNDWRTEIIGVAAGARGVVAFQNVGVAGNRTAQITITWPAQPNGIVLTTTVLCPVSICPA
ncbi:MAG: prepilin-type N-terminal cleavage/methylation domain-containing protein [Nitrospirae bacterium]|nr:prepilin-type N-terminal cleavage/methylation domain-containing protein [Candidatus Troglogloeales bacterium]